MHRPCINHPVVNHIESVDEKFKVLKDAGFECVDFDIYEYLSGKEISSGSFNELFNSDIPSILDFFKPYKEASEKYGVEIYQAHAPYQLYVDGNDEINEKCFDVLEKTMAICEYFSCKYLVVHPIKLAFSRGRDYERQINLEYHAKMIPLAKKYSVTVCLENIYQTCDKHITESVCSDCNEAVNYIDRLNEMAGEEIFGFCFDLGHMTLLGKHISESLKTLGHRVKLLHIHDNDAIQDHHAIPYTYVRNWGKSPITDWEGFLEGLKAINYQGELDFEVSLGCKVAPPELLHDSLVFVHSVGEYFAKRLQEK